MLSMIVILFFSQEIIQLNKEPLKENAVEFKHIATIDNGDDGFYSYISYKIAKNGDIVVFDVGNSRVHVYDSNGKEKVQFGEEGNGPEELTNATLIHVSDVIVFYKNLNYVMFDLNGNYLNTIKLVTNHHSAGQAFEKDGHIFIYYQYMQSNKFRYIEIDKSGNLVKIHDNPDYKDYLKIKDQITDYDAYFQNARFETKSLTNYDASKFLRHGRGEFNLELLDNDFIAIKQFNYDLERVDIDMSKSRSRRFVNGKRDFEGERRDMENYYKAFKGFYPDIKGVKGVVNKYIFLSVIDDGERKERTMVISPGDKLYTFATFSDKDCKSWSIQKNKMIAYYRNDTQGPFIKIFDVIIK